MSVETAIDAVEGDAHAARKSGHVKTAMSRPRTLVFTPDSVENRMMDPGFKAMISQFKYISPRGKAFALLAFALAPGFACVRGREDVKKLTSSSQRPVRIVIDQAPLTLNPRMAIDAVGQRLGALLFSGLTRVDEHLEVKPALAKEWRLDRDRRSWVFSLQPDLKDHAGQPIGANDVIQCLEQYRIGKPVSRLSGALPGWKGTSVTPSGEVRLELERPDPYLPRNASSLRFYRLKGNSTPCVDPEVPGGAPDWVGSGAYLYPKGGFPPDFPSVLFEPAEAGRYPTVEFIVVRDELQRVMRLIQGDGDIAQNTISLVRTRWLQREFSDRFNLVERNGVNVSYLAFNVRDPVLAKKEVRQALAHAVPRIDYINHKMGGFGSLAGSLLAPPLAESLQIPYSYDPNRAQELLEQAGFPLKNDKTRLTLKFRTTPVREGFETALILQEAFRKVGVVLELDIVEPAAFLSAIRKGAFQIYSSRWVGVADGSILNRTMRSGTANNRVGYADTEADRLLEQMLSQNSESTRIALAHEVQKKMIEDLPYFPLWYWGNALLIGKNVDPGIRPEQLSLSGAYEPLLRALAKVK